LISFVIIWIMSSNPHRVIDHIDHAYLKVGSTVFSSFTNICYQGFSRGC